MDMNILRLQVCMDRRCLKEDGKFEPFELYGTNVKFLNCLILDTVTSIV